MDYSYFNTAQQQQQPYHLYGVPHAGNPPPDEFSGVSQPVLPFDYNYGSMPSSYSAIGIPPPHSPPESFTRHSNKSTDLSHSDIAGSQTVDNHDDPIADGNNGRSSSEEKDNLTPAQSRRKAQNRAAQRAFRERKERHVRELEQKLSELEQASSNLHADNERLKRELARIATENEILRATSSSASGSNGVAAEAENTTTGPLQFSPTDLEKSLAESRKDGNLPHRIVVSSKTGEKLLNARAAWDMIQNHKLFKQGLVDIGDVCERLKSFVLCDGQGPVYEEGRIRKAIEESVACGNDELI